jgi:23S rRNA pseudouridine1911/1915/1917 synthase
MTVTVTADQAGITLTALIRSQVSGLSWREVRRLIEIRRVKIDGELCLDPARRVKEGQTIELLAKPAAPARQQETIVLRYLDRHLVVVEKPSGLNTVRHPSERDWTKRRKALSPTLEDLVSSLIARTDGRPSHSSSGHLRIVQRLDKETSGLLVFARTVEAERGLGKQFRRHTVTRRYLALVPGRVAAQRIATRLVRDRGDRRRGNSANPELGKEAITHVEVVEQLPGYTLLGCRLETGRTHQIRIHLAELDHPVCGVADLSGAPRLALHAAELGFVHPVSGESLQWSMPLPPDLAGLFERLRGGDRE